MEKICHSKGLRKFEGAVLPSHTKKKLLEVELKVSRLGTRERKELKYPNQRWGEELKASCHVVYHYTRTTEE